jgi:hypothetical protein
MSPKRPNRIGRAPTEAFATGGFVHKEASPRGDYQRRSGRTTAICLSTLAQAISTPFTAIPLVDHHGTAQANDHLALMVRDTILALELHRMYILQRNGDYFLQCGRHERSCVRTKVCFHS